MITLTVKNLAGKEVGKLELDERLFGLPQNDALVHQVYVALSGNLRNAIAHTKDRSERAGSGKKPWRQKGTGRARAGMVRSPLWRKGGVTFGPTKERNFKKDTNQKMRQKAVLVALSEKIRQGKLVLVDELQTKETKTKAMATALVALGIAPKSVLISLNPNERAMARLSRNIPKVTLAESVALNVREILDAEYALMSKASVSALEQRFASWKQ